MSASSIKRILLVAVLAGVVGICFFVSRSGHEPVAGEAVGAAAAETWTCSMHPQVRLPKPGKCPICSMPLVPAKGGMPAPSEGGAEMLTLSDHARAMAAVETAPVERRKLSREVRAVGKVQYNETALATITSRVEGYIERLFVDYTGVEVKPGDHLVEIYSPDLATAANELLISIEGNLGAPLITAARLKLERLGLTRGQIDEIAARRQPGDRVTLLSPIKGTVTEKMVVLKSGVKSGDVLYRLANLESVWVYLDIYEYELPWVHYGQEVVVSAEALPGVKFNGRVWFINPVLTEESRTVKVLLNIQNEGQRLKPGMFVSAVIRSQLLADGSPAPTGIEGKFSCPMHPVVVETQAGKCRVCGMELTQIPGKPGAPVAEKDQLVLAIPATAVLDSGLRKLVYVERTKGEFAAVEITTGPRAGDWFPVFAGLKEGDRVAVRGNFLLDSQFQIAGRPSLFYREGQAGAGGHQHSAPGAQPQTAQPAGHEGHAPKPAPPSKPPEHKH